MTRLVRAEFRRIAARRLVRVTVVFAFIAIVLGGFLAFAKSGEVSEAQYQQRVRTAQVQERSDGAKAQTCLVAHGVKPGADYPAAVARECFPDRPPPNAADPRFHRARLGNLLQGSSGVLAIIGWALGASLLGSEFASRSMTTLLTWETRRTRVFVAKAAVVVLMAAAFAVVALTFLAVAMLPALLAHGAPLRAGDPSIASLAAKIGRGALLVALASGMGLGIATIGRNTAAALGAGFAYIIVLENIVGNSLRDWRRWLLLGNAIVLVSGHSNASDVPGRSVGGAGLFLAAVAGALLIGAAAAFRTRDIA
jgi:ABC-2 type transport system permease protein